MCTKGYFGAVVSLKFSFLLTYKDNPEVVVPSDDTLQFKLGDS